LKIYLKEKPVPQITLALSLSRILSRTDFFPFKFSSATSLLAIHKGERKKKRHTDEEGEDDDEFEEEKKQQGEEQEEKVGRKETKKFFLFFTPTR